jgi:MSHA pilin protein MshA
MRRQSGFTLIELVIVIVVLGILAALAVPRFISLQREARIAVIDSLFNSVRSGSNIVYAKSAAIGQSDLATGSVDIDGASVPGGVIATVYGYPAATQAAMNLLFDNLSPRYGFTGVGTGLRIDIDGIPACSVTYTPPTAAGIPPTIVRSITNC